MSATKVQDARLHHRVQEWAKSSPGSTPTERDTDAIVSWLRSLRGTDYARKPADGLRRQVLKVISQMRATAPAPVAAEWSIDPQPEPGNLKSNSGQKRPLESTTPLAGKAARIAAAAAANASSGGRDHSPSGARSGEGGGGHNLLNASIRSAMATSAGSSAPAEAGDDENGAAPAADGADDVGAAASGKARQSKKERKAERRAAGASGASGASGGVSTGTSAGGLGYAALGGMDDVLQQVRELVEYPLTHPEIYVHLGVEPPRGLLLHGPPGCGKTLLATSIASELGVAFLRISAPEVVSGMSGESEAKIRGLFKEAAEAAPALIFIDEIDAIAPKRETAQREMERRIVAQLLTCMDELNFVATGGQSVIVMGATNRPDAIDPALRRAGRFDREIALGIPDTAARERILAVMCKGMRLSGDLDMMALAKKCNGFVGADLAALCKEAAVVAVNRIFGDLFGVSAGSAAGGVITSRRDDAPASSEPRAGAAHEAVAASEIPAVDGAKADPDEEQPAAGALTATDSSPTALMTNAEAASAARKRQSAPLSADALSDLAIGIDDFEAGLLKVQPSAQREGFATVPDVSWEDVGGLIELRAEMHMAIVQPIRTPERFEALGLKPSCGVLLHGPPGCGKTLLAKAIANESAASFISVKGPELLNKFVGESERAVRALFARGRASAPCVVFFDELDALVPRRGGDSSSQASERVVNQMLTEMDGMDATRQVFVVAATNRPDMIDPAMLRPGRLDKLVYVPLPTADGRLDILRTATKRMPLDATVDLDAIVRDQRCVGFSGADLSALAREAAVAALKACTTDATPSVSAANFAAAFESVQPSVSPQDEMRYKRLAEKLRRTRASSGVEPPKAATGESGAGNAADAADVA